MRKRTQHRRSTQRNDWCFFLCLGILITFFSVGAILGQVLASGTSESVDAELTRYLMDYCTLDAGETDIGPVFLSALLIYFRYPLAAILLGFAVPGAAFLPLLATTFGFFLSFSICCFASTFGSTGILLAVCIFGLRCLVSLPCFFLVAVPAFRRSALRFTECISARGKRILKPVFSPESWLGLAILAAILLAGSLVEVFIPPMLLKQIAQIYF